MTTTPAGPPETQGLEIAWVRLERSRFDRHSGGGDENSAERSLQRRVGTRVVSDDAEGLSEIELSVEVIGVQGKHEQWFAECTYRGAFRIKDGDASRSVFQNELCPAILYGFAREHIFDLTRRAGFTGAILPPVNFRSVAEKGTGLPKDAGTKQVDKVGKKRTAKGSARKAKQPRRD